MTKSTLRVPCCGVWLGGSSSPWYFAMNCGDRRQCGQRALLASWVVCARQHCQTMGTTTPRCKAQYSSSGREHVSAAFDGLERPLIPHDAHLLDLQLQAVVAPLVPGLGLPHHIRQVVDDLHAPGYRC
jgi:hypothetical protein